MYIQHLSPTGVLSEHEHEATVMFCLVLLLLKYPRITQVEHIWEYLSPPHFQNGSKMASRIHLGKSLTPQKSPRHNKTQTVTDRLLQMPSGEWAFEQENWAKTELIQKGSPASYSRMEKRNISHSDISLGFLPDWAGWKRRSEGRTLLLYGPPQGRRKKWDWEGECPIWSFPGWWLAHQWLTNTHLSKTTHSRIWPSQGKKGGCSVLFKVSAVLLKAFVGGYLLQRKLNLSSLLSP